MRYLVFIIALFAALQTNAQNNIVYGAGINYTNGAPTFTPPVRTSRVAIDTITGRWYHFNTPGGWQLIGNTIEEIAGCTAPAYTPGKGDSKVVINNCSPQPELYFYNGSAWVLVGGGSVYAGEGIRIENDTIILDSLNFLDFRTGNALDGDVGRVQWNDTDGTLDLNLKGGNVTLQIGQEEVTLVKHADNSGLIEGRVVYIVGSDGANKTVRYAKADSDATSATTFGLMTESATGGNKAFCTTFGLVRNLNTTNLTEGGIVWLSADTAGTMTAVRPTAPDHGVMIGFCVRKHATQGAIFVQVQNGYELNELHDVFVPSPTNGQVLTWNSTNTRWEAITPANQLQTISTDGSAGNISISSGNTITLNVNDADASTTNELQTLSTGTNTLTLSNGGGTVTVDTNPADDVTGSGASGQVSFWTGSQTQSGDNNFFWDNSNKALGIGTTLLTGSALRISKASTNISDYNPILVTPTLDAGTTNSTLNSTLPTASATTSITNLRHYRAAQGTFIAGASVAVQRGFEVASSMVGGGQNQAFVGLVPDATSNWNLYMFGTAKNYLAGNTSIGSTTSTARLRVTGSGNTSTTWTAQFHNSANNNNALMIRDDGAIAIGTSAPNVSAVLTIASTTQGVLFPRMTTAQRDLIATPADGLVIYNTTDNKLQVRAGGAWVDLH